MSQIDVAGPSSSGGAWGMRYPASPCRRGRNTVKEFTGMWPPQARRRPGGVHEGAGPGRLDQPPGASFSES